MREASALVERVELTIPGEAENVIAGYRRNGALSLFFGSQPVYQFNTLGELRRGYVEDSLLKANAGALVSMVREEEATRTVLRSRPLSPAAQELLLKTAHDRLLSVSSHLTNGTFQLVAVVPDDVDVAQRLRDDLRQLVQQPVIVAQVPNVV
jgi:hypothetical protein